MAAGAGAWLPHGNLSRLGNHPSIGLLFLLGSGRFYIGLAYDFRLGNTPAAYTYYNPNTVAVERTVSFFGMLFGPDFRWEFQRAGSASVFLAAGVGYDMIMHLAVPRSSGLRSAFSDTVNFNGGLVLRRYFTADHGAFLDLDMRAHTVYFGSGYYGGDDLSGYYFTVALLAGYRLPFYD